MHLFTLFLALWAPVFARADLRVAKVFIQPILASSPTPSPFAEVAYDPASLASSSLYSFEAPEIAAAASEVRIGMYDPKSKRWLSGTTVAGVDNFSKGYSLNIMLTIDSRGEVLSVACKGVRIDAGQTRDFGPKAVVLVETTGMTPQLNKPVVLSPGGKMVEPEPEKTFLQK